MFFFYTSCSVSFCRTSILSFKFTISTNQLVKFFRPGFIAGNIDDSPGGFFTLFMFRPTSHTANGTVKEEQNAIRSQLGNSKLDEAMIRFYAENDFFHRLRCDPI